MHDSVVVWQVMGSIVDVAHALLMAAWVLGLPFLFVHRWPRMTRAYGVYAISFILLSQLSQLAWGECFLTVIASRLWEHGSGAPDATSNEWFTVRLASWVFHMTPSHGAIALVSELLILLTAMGALLSLRLSHPRPRLTARRR